jgi:probable HAF family extracellular repeat protein
MTSRFLLSVSALNLLIALVSPIQVSAQNRPSPSYALTDLGPVGPFGQPFHIADSGLISGAAAAKDGTDRAVLWYRRLRLGISKPGLGGLNSAAFGVNVWGQTVGDAETSVSDPNGEDFCGFHFLGYPTKGTTCLPFRWRIGEGMTALPTLAGNQGHNGTANSISHLGVIAGVAENTTMDSTCPPYDPTNGQTQQFQFKPVVWKKGKPSELPTAGNDPDGIAFSINDKGQIVGASGTCSSFNISNFTFLHGLHALIWQHGIVTDLGNLGGVAPGSGNVAIAVNNYGQVVGVSGLSDNATFHGFLWTEHGQIQDLGTFPGDVNSVALNINDAGGVVGMSLDANFVPRAVLWQNKVPLDLNTLISGGSQLYLLFACSINSEGQIIGLAVTQTGEPHGFLLTPIRQ